MFCKYCGQQIMDGSVFCAYCGKTLTTASTPAAPSQPVASTPASPVTPTAPGMSTIPTTAAVPEMNPYSNPLPQQPAAPAPESVITPTVSSPAPAIGETTAAVRPEASAETTAPAQPATIASKDVKPKKSKKWIGGLIFLILALLCFAAGGLAAYYHFFLSDEAKVKKLIKEAQDYVVDGDYDNAIASYESALEIDASNEDSYFAIANIYDTLAEESLEAGNKKEAKEYWQKEIEILQRGYDNTGNEEFQTRITELEEKLKPEIGMKNAFVTSDGDFDYLLVPVVEGDDVEKLNLVKKAKDQSLDQAEVLVKDVDQEAVLYGFGLVLVEEKVFYTDLNEQGDDLAIKWISKDGKEKGSLPGTILKDYKGLAEKGEAAKSLYYYYEGPVPSLAEGISYQASVYEYYLNSYCEGKWLLFDSTFLINLEENTIEPINFPEKQNYYYISVGIFQNKVYYTKLTEKEASDGSEQIILYSYDLEEGTEAKVCALDLDLDEFWEGCKNIYAGGFYYTDYDWTLYRVDLETGDKTMICEEVLVDAIIPYIEDDGMIYYETEDGVCRQCTIEGKNDRVIPSAQKIYEKTGTEDIIQFYGISGENIYYALDFEPYLICVPIDGEGMDLSVISEEVVEKQNVQSDMQLCDSMRTAILTSMLDPAVIDADKGTIDYFSDGEWHYITELGGVKDWTGSAFKAAVYEIIGFDPADIDSRIVSHFNGGKANGMRFCVDGSRIRIEIENSDYTGKKGADGAKPIGIY